GSADATMRRAARLGDGWMPIMAADAQAEQKLAALREQLKSFGRDPAKFGIESWLRMPSPDPQGWAAAADGWRRLGADMVMLYPMYRILNFDEHIETLRRFQEGASGEHEDDPPPYHPAWPLAGRAHAAAGDARGSAAGNRQPDHYPSLSTTAL